MYARRPRLGLPSAMPTASGAADMVYLWRAFHDAAALHRDDPEFLFTHVDVTRVCLA